MKKGLFILLAALPFFCGTIQAQTDIPLDESAMYFDKNELPDATVWLPAPPDTMTTQFVYDITQYMWGKTQRLNEKRAQQAIDHVVVNIDEMAKLFSVPFGMEISLEKTPAIYRVLYRGVFTMRLSASKPKTFYQRKRPYARFNEHTLIPEEEEELKTNGSYPSGHTLRGWAMALLLCEINPDAQDSLLKLGYEWGQSRVIAGYHWQSDVDASRLLASAVYARLHTNAEFLADIAAARAEYAALTGKNSASPAVSKKKGSSAVIYNMRGEKVSGKAHKRANKKRGRKTGA